jgi:hypothetical protein
VEVREWSPERWSLGRRGAVVRQLEGALTLLGRRWATRANC